MKRLAALAILILIALSFSIMVAEMPEFGHEENPINNEVKDRYVYKGYEETNNQNTVAGVLVEYRALDTFGELTVLFTSMTAIMAVLMGDEEEEEE